MTAHIEVLPEIRTKKKGHISALLKPLGPYKLVHYRKNLNDNYVYDTKRYWLWTVSVKRNVYQSYLDYPVLQQKYALWTCSSKQASNNIKKSISRLDFHIFKTHKFIEQ